jgi:hypothetical protein
LPQLSSLSGAPAVAQLIDRTTALNTSGDGIALSLSEQIGAGHGDWFIADSSSFLINRDPYCRRAQRRHGICKCEIVISPLWGLA